MGSNDGNLLKVSKLKNVAKGFFLLTDFYAKAASDLLQYNLLKTC